MSDIEKTKLEIQLLMTDIEIKREHIKQMKYSRTHMMFTATTLVVEIILLGIIAFQLLK